MEKFEGVSCAERSTMLPAPRSPVTITLTPTWQGGAIYTFDATVKFAHPGKGQGHKDGNLEFLKGVDTFMLTFKIANSPRRLQFAGVPDVLWLGPPPTCPTSRWTLDGEITVYACMGDTLILRNNNATEQKWKYALQMIDVDNNPVSYDPIISNGGGGRDMSQHHTDEEGGEHRHRN